MDFSPTLFFGDDFMPTFKNLKQLEKYLQLVVKDSMEDVGREAEHKVRKKIDEMVYQNPTEPSDYERTRELKNSLVHTQPKQNGNEITVEIKHEDSLIGYYEPNQHMSVVDGSELPVDALAEIVHYGKSGKIFGEGYWTKPRPYMETAKEEIIEEKLHVKALKNSLKKKGLDVV